MHTQPRDAPEGRLDRRRHVELAVAEYVDWFNHRRLHGEIGMVPPAELEAAHWASAADRHYRHTPALAEAGPN